MKDTTQRQGTQIRTTGRMGSISVPNALTEWDGLDPYDFRVAVWLSSHTAEYAKSVSQVGIARRLNMAQGRVIKSLTRLKELGLVQIDSGGPRGSKLITFDLDAWQSLPPLTTRELTSHHVRADLSPRETQEDHREDHREVLQSETSSPPRRERPRDAIWDALTEYVGPVATRAEESRRAGVAKQLKAVDASAEQILDRCREYRRRWPNVDLTDTALVSHWSALANVTRQAADPRGVQDKFGNWHPREY